MEDQEMEQYLESSQQNYMIDNINAVAGCGGTGVSDVGSGEKLGGVKYDEQLQNEKHDVGDDDELKYVKEVQQSEKQQSAKDLGDYSSDELAEYEVVKHKYEIGNGATDVDGIQDGDTCLNNGHGAWTEKNDGAEILPPGSNVFQAVQNTSVEVTEKSELDDDEPCSIATIGTSSISENASIPLPIETEASTPPDFGNRQPHDIDFEQTQSQLNPDAKEFVPNFGSNPSSPINPDPMDLQAFSADYNIENQKYFEQGSATVPRHILVDDDFVAQSPRKGRGDNMDTIALPPEQEFDEEADLRPHELEQCSGDPQEIELSNDANQVLIHDHISEDNTLQHSKELDDFQTSEINVHGPETSVDICTDVTTQHSEIENDVMKQSIYVTSDEPIEDLLNSVQPIPTEMDSTNNSSTEELISGDLIGDKELLQVEEKEHISNSPSTEEIQVHVQSPDNLADSDLVTDPLDINKEVVMQATLFFDQQCHAKSSDTLEETQVVNPTLDTTSALVGNENNMISSFEEVQNSENNISSSGPTTHGLTETRTGISDDMRSDFSTGESLFLDLGETGLEQKISELEINSDVLPTQIKDEAFVSPGTNDGNISELLCTPEEIKKNSEEISTRHENIETTPVNEGMECEDIPVKDIKQTLPLLTPKSTENMEGVNSISDNNLLAENVSETFSGVVSTNSQTDNAKPDFVVEDHSPTSFELKSENNTNVQHPEICSDVVYQNSQTDNAKSPSVLEDHSPTSLELLVKNPETLEPEDNKNIQQNLNKTEPLKAEDNKNSQHPENHCDVVCQNSQTDIAKSLLVLEDHSPASLELISNNVERLEPEGNKNIQQSLDKVENEMKATGDSLTKDVVKSTLLGPESIGTIETEPHQDESKITENISKIKDDNILGVQTMINNIATESSSNADIAANDAIVTSLAKNISPSEGLKIDNDKKSTAKTTTNTSKSKVGSVPNTTSKKSTASETAKKTMGIPSKPKLPSKTAIVSNDKKLTKPASVGTTLARKITNNSTTATKAIPKVASTTSATRATSATTSATKTIQSKPIAAARTASSASSVRKPAAAQSSITVGKPRPASSTGTASAQAKPTSLGSSAGKVKLASPRATLTSQLRKTGPVSTGSKSPVKSTTSSSITKTVASTLGNRPKPTSSVGTAGTANSKQSSRPAPKSPIGITNTSTTTRRLTIGSGTNSITSSTQATGKTTSSTVRKSSPIKHVTGKTPTKSANSIGIVKSKSAAPTKPVELKLNVDDTNKESCLNGTTTSSHAHDDNDRMISNINDPPTEGQNDESADPINLISA